MEPMIAIRTDCNSIPRKEQIAEARRIYQKTVDTSARFQGQAIYVPYLWALFINDLGGSQGPEGIVNFTITAMERETFPELGLRLNVALRKVDNRVEEVS